jgi:hypothetical protein
MWRRGSTSSDEPEQVKSECLDDDSLPQRSHSDEPRFYRPLDQVQVSKRPRSSSPDLDRGRVNIKRRCMSETSAGTAAFHVLFLQKSDDTFVDNRGLVV